MDTYVNTSDNPRSSERSERNSLVRFLFWQRTTENMPFRRGSQQTFGHTALWINDLVFSCELQGETNWYDADHFLLCTKPFISLEFTFSGDLEKAVDGLVSGLQYDLRSLVREVKDSVIEPQAVNCVWGGRRFLRNIGVDSYARVPDEFFREVLHLTGPLRDSVAEPAGLGAGCVVVWDEGFRVDSTFARES